MNTEAHRQKMAAKKAARATMQPGFKPIRNGRISGRFDALMAIIALQNPKLPTSEIAARADRTLRSELPSAPMVRRTRFKQTKNNDPVYRKQVVAPVAKPKRSRAKKATVS